MSQAGGFPKDVAQAFLAWGDGNRRTNQDDALLVPAISNVPHKEKGDSGRPLQMGPEAPPGRLGTG